MAGGHLRRRCGHVDDGIELGPVLLVLEVRFNRPGRYPYHGSPGSEAVGTITVEGPAQPGPALEIWSPGGNRVVATLPVPTAANGRPEPPAWCPVTRPTQPFVPTASYAVQGDSSTSRRYPAQPPTSDGTVWYGTDDLWTELEPAGAVWWGLPQDASGLSQETSWWGGAYTGPMAEPNPAIAVHGRRLDGGGQTFEAGNPGTNASAVGVGSFMIVGLTIPTPGCWNIRAEYRGHSLEYVVWVARS